MTSKVLFCVLSCIVLWCLISVSEGLKANDVGVCEIKRSAFKTRRVTYRVTINKWCGKKKCTVTKSKVQRYVVAMKQQVCCNGFKYDSAEDTCVPLCSTGCSGGQCIAPDVCRCDPPAVFDGNGTCVTCDPPCFNAKCISNNTCLCDSDFTVYNTSHCYRCEPGFIVDEHFNCTSRCENACVNGTCSADICTCHAGFNKRDEFTCEPQCECVNGICVAPGVCECVDGYTKINGTHCAPKCDNCVNGTCIGPDQCECDNGYDKTDNGCVPMCDANCSNGFCSGPNVCTCDDGYVNMDNDTSKPCVKNCSGGSYDINGECSTDNCTSNKYCQITNCKDKVTKACGSRTPISAIASNGWPIAWTCGHAVICIGNDAGGMIDAITISA